MIRSTVLAAAMVLVVGGSFAMASGVGAFGKGGPRSTPAKVQAPTTQAVEKYACPMNCVESDKPGKCPKCGMEMKKVEAKQEKPKQPAKKPSGHEGHGH